MQFVMHVPKPDDVEVTLTATMRLSEWEQIAKEIPDRWPNWKFRSAIHEAVRQISAQIRVTDKEVGA